MRNIYLTFLVCFFLLKPAISQNNVFLSGFVSDAHTGEALINATVSDTRNMVGVVSNNYGFYTIKASGKGLQQFTCSFVGYRSQTIEMDVSRDTVLNFKLEKGIEIAEVLVTSERRNLYKSQPLTGIIEMDASLVKKLPTLFGEADLARMVQLMPGVQSGKEGTGGLYVRGGTTDQNLILLDGMPVYNANHIGGFISIFNPSAINYLRLYKGGFPAKYGGRLSSILDIRMKNGNMQHKEGSYTIGTLTSSFSYECPVKKDTSSFIIAGRRTVYDLLVSAYNLLDTEGKSDAGYSLWDMNVKYNKKLDENSRLYLSFYNGRDKIFRRGREESKVDGVAYNYSQYYRNEWGNTTASVRLNKVYAGTLFANYTVGISNFQYKIQNTLNVEYDGKMHGKNDSRFNSSITDYSLLADFERPLGNNHFLHFGAQTTLHQFSPSENKLSRVSPNTAPYDSTWGAVQIFSPEIALYASDQYRILRNLNADIGLRVSAFFVEGSPIIIPEPRLVLNYEFTDNASLKFSFSKMSQFSHLISTSDQALPSDFWLPSTKGILPERSSQVSLGSFLKLKQKHVYDFTIDFFYKKFENLVEIKGGSSFIQSGNDWADHVLTDGRGYVLGGEFLLEKVTGKTTGWIAYTLSKNMRQFEEIDNNQWFPFRYDRRHELSIVLNQQISEHVHLSAVWVFMTGEAISLAKYKYLVNTLQFNNEDDAYEWFGEAYFYNGRNAFRTKPYHRFDININFEKKLPGGIRTWSIGAYNTYNQYNPYYMYIGKNKEGESRLYSFTLFPIMPSISYTYKF
jgi:hypothetical protein